MASKEIDIYFVVLHYKVYLDTIECVDSILSLNNLSKIVVVDNYSNNGSIEIIEEKYKNNDLVIIIKNKSNLGFAKGNNVGFKYAKDNGAKYIVVTNNDIIFNDKNFILTTKELYEKYQYGVLGPDIVDKSKSIHQNPLVTNKIDSKLYCIYRIIRKYISILFVKLNIDSFFVKRRNRKVSLIRRNICEEMILDDTSDKMLQGSCLIFSPNYIEKFDGLYDKTFMYCEEIILAYLCKINNLSMLYSSKTYVIHKGACSTNLLYNTTKNKLIFEYKQSAKSLLSLYKILK